MRFPGKLSLGTEELTRAGNSLKTLFLECKTSPFPCVGKTDQKLAWQSKDLLLKLRGKMEIHSQWEQGHVAWGVQG